MLDEYGLTELRPKDPEVMLRIALMLEEIQGYAKQHDVNISLNARNSGAYSYAIVHKDARRSYYYDIAAGKKELVILSGAECKTVIFPDVNFEELSEEPEHDSQN